MNRSESKYFNTAKRMDEAMLSLLQEKDFDYISITEVCKKAGVNRSTFYLHYENIIDLYNETMEYVNNRFFAYFQTTAKETIDKIKNDKDGNFTILTAEYLDPYLDFIKKNKELVRAALRKPINMESTKKYNSLYKYIIEPITANYNVPEKYRPYVSIFFTRGIMAIIEEWLCRDCEESVENIRDLILNLFNINKQKAK